MSITVCGVMESYYSVLIIGGGNAGLCAALSAAEHTSDILLVEAAPKPERGGNTKYTRDIRYAHDIDSYTTGEYRDDEFVNDVIRVTNHNTDVDLLKMVVSESRNIPFWLQNKDVLIHKALKGTLHLGRTNLFMFGGGKAMINSYYDAAEKLGIKIEYNTKCTDLEFSGNRVTNASLNSPEGTRTIKVGSVVVASGGLEANLEWLSEYWGSATGNFIVRGTRHNRGELLRVLLRHNTKTIGNLGQFHSVAVDARSPKFDGGIVTRIDSVPYSITVNRDGDRFYDEGEDLWPKRYAIWGRLIAEQPGQLAFSIVDSKAINLFLPTVFEPVMDDTISGLAIKLGISPENLSRTVMEYNQSLKRKCTFNPEILDDCSTSGLAVPKSHWAAPIDSPPFYGYSFRPGITFTYYGVKVNSKGQVLSENGNPNKNLFAAGEIMSGNILSEGYLAGFGLTIGTIFGIIAGKEAVSAARS